MEANGTAYMVMALVRGETLETTLRREGALPQAAIERLVHPLLDGLEIVHEAGFLHRDIKPANILLDGQKRQEEKRKAEEEAQRAQEEEARRRAQQQPSAPPQSAATPPPAAGVAVARFNGNYVGQFCQPAYGNFQGLCWAATVVVANGTLSGRTVSRSGTPSSWRGSVAANGAVDMQYDSVSIQINPGAAAPARLRGTINGNVMELSGRWLLVDRALTGRFQRQN